MDFNFSNFTNFTADDFKGLFNDLKSAQFFDTDTQNRIFNQYINQANRTGQEKTRTVNSDNTKSDAEKQQINSKIRDILKEQVELQVKLRMLAIEEQKAKRRNLSALLEIYKQEMLILSSEQRQLQLDDSLVDDDELRASYAEATANAQIVMQNAMQGQLDIYDQLIEKAEKYEKILDNILKKRGYNTESKPEEPEYASVIENVKKAKDISNDAKKAKQDFLSSSGKQLLLGSGSGGSGGLIPPTSGGLLSGDGSDPQKFTGLLAISNNALSTIAPQLKESLPLLTGNQTKLLEKLADFSDKVGQAVESMAKTLSTQLPQLDARLQTSNVLYGYGTSILEEVQDRFSASTLVDQKTLMANITRFVNEGVSFNVEQRALYATLSDRMVTTFDALDSTLTNLIRVTQTDMTASQLGAEALLTQFLNENFDDTSYLGTSGGSGIYDKVLSEIAESMTKMNVNQGTSFAYSVQKWLGSLYSMGASESTVTTIAKGLGYLASGDVSSLSSNTGLTNILALSAQQAGLSYSDMLVKGVNAENINDLMKAMVSYLASIASNTNNNNVLATQWSNTLGVTLTDLRAAQNLYGDIETVYNSNTNLTANQAAAETDRQIKNVAPRSIAATLWDTFGSNIEYTYLTNFATNSSVYGAYKTGQVADELGKFISVFDPTSGLMLQGVAKGVKILTSVFEGIETAADIIQSLSFQFNEGTVVPFFDWDVYNTRGEEFYDMYSPGVTKTSTISKSLSTNEIIQSISSSATVASQTSEVIQSFAKQAETVAETNSSVTGVAQEITQASDNIYTELFINKTPINVNVASVDSSAADTISGVSQYTLNELLDIIKNGKIAVDVNDNDINSMISSINMMRGF